MAVRSDSITNFAGTGAPDFPQGIKISGLKHLHATRSATVTGLTTGTYNTVILDNVVTNTFGSEYNSGTGVFTASEAGFYLLTGGLTVVSAVAGSVTQALGTFYKNSNEESDNFGNISTATDQDITVFQVSGSKLISLSALDTIALRAYCATSTGTWNIAGSASDEPTYMTITKIG